MQDIGVFGIGGHGREIASIISLLEKSNAFRFKGYIDQIEKDDVNGYPSINIQKWLSKFPDGLVSVGIGNSKLRKSISEELTNFGLKLATIIHPNVEIMSSVKIGEGCTIFYGTVLTVNIEIGENVHINSNCSISHDVKIGDYTTISPGVQICGNVHVGKNVFIGAGTTIINGNEQNPIKIADDTIIGAGSCVTKSIITKGTYCGVPAKIVNSTTLYPLNFSAVKSSD